MLPAVLARGGQQTIRAEHRLDTADRLARTVPVLDQREADVGITIVAKANPRRDANLRFIKQLFRKLQRPHGGADQQRCVELFTANMPGENLYHAKLHRDTIACFGRFPWRNDALGRPASAAENRVMQAGGYGALISGKLSLDDLA